MKQNSSTIIEQFRELITDSCSFKKNPSQKHINFHREFLKLHFGVIDVQIDYDAQTILIRSPKPMYPDSVSLRNLDQSVTGKIDYDDLECTLLGCVEEDALQIRFYEHFLTQYKGDSASA